MRRSFVAVVVTCGLAVIASIAAAQYRTPAKHSQIDVTSPQAAAEEGYDGGFRFCRIRFNTSPDGDGAGWFVDYPRADENLSLRLSQLTRIPVTTVGEGDPVRLVLQLTETDLFQCPFVMMTEPGGADLSAQEAAQLGAYLRKGGFLWADDFWGSRAWEWWSMQIAKALPPGEFPIVEVPLDHPMFHTMFDIREIPQIPNIGFYFNSGGGTSERYADSAVPHVRAINNAAGDIMMLMTHNTDFGDAFEREGEDRRYFDAFATIGYAFGVNVYLYAMTH